MRRRARIDANQPEIVKALRDMGATVQSLAAVGKGCPDLLVGYKGSNYLFEVKDGSKSASVTRMTNLENNWHCAWQGWAMVVYNPTQATSCLRAIAGERV